MLKNIVSHINNELAKGLPGNVKLIGIAQALPRVEDDAIQILPSYVNNDGEAKYVGPDDEHDVIVYHKVNSISISKAVINKGYGDSKGYTGNIARLSIIIFGQRNKIKMSDDELAFMLQLYFPEALNKTQLQQHQLAACNINLSEKFLNDMQVFGEEFKNIEYFLKPEQFLFKMNYTIESAFNRKCFDKCFTTNCN